MLHLHVAHVSKCKCTSKWHVRQVRLDLGLQLDCFVSVATQHLANLGEMRAVRHALTLHLFCFVCGWAAKRIWFGRVALANEQQCQTHTM